MRQLLCTKIENIIVSKLYFLRSNISGLKFNYIYLLVSFLSEETLKKKRNTFEKKNISEKKSHRKTNQKNTPETLDK